MMASPPLIAIGPAELGYCLLCRHAATVVLVQLESWAHRAWVCDPCVQDLAKTVHDRVVALNPPRT